VYTYTVVHYPVVESLRDAVPYAVVAIELDDAPGPRLISNLVDVAPEDVRIGLEVELAWDEPRPGVVLPRFRRRVVARLEG
jgi:uncharacterized OB-fold protein